MNYWIKDKLWVKTFEFNTRRQNLLQYEKQQMKRRKSRTII